MSDGVVAPVSLCVVNDSGNISDIDDVDDAEDADADLGHADADSVDDACEVRGVVVVANVGG
jgi:hypothetical protein